MLFSVTSHIRVDMVINHVILMALTVIGRSCIHTDNVALLMGCGQEKKDALRPEKQRDAGNSGDDTGRKYKCMRCGRRSKYATHPGTCRGFKWMEKYFNMKLKKRGSRHTGGHDFQRLVDTNGKMLVWCRKSFGYARGKLLRHCQPRECWKERINECCQRIQKLEEGQVLVGKDWRMEEKVRVTWKDFRRLDA